MTRQLTLLPLVFVMSSATIATQPAEPFKPGKLPPADVAALQTGLTLRFYAKPADAKALDARRVRLAALHVPKDDAPTPFLDPGPMHARFSGYLKNSLKGDFRFRLTGTGTMSLRINDKDILKQPGEVEVELAKNYNKIEIVYASPKNGDATVRLEWSGEKFGFEPVPPDVLFSRKDDADLVVTTAWREGRELFATRHCAKCHLPPANVKRDAYKMPELQSDVIRLDNASNRFQHDWLVVWIMNPRHLHPEATMPAIRFGKDPEKNAVDLAAYLTSLNNGPAFQPLGMAPKATDGEALFKKLGCVTCHRLNDPAVPDELGRLSLHYVGAKYKTNALAHFLKEPHKHNRWTRMPDFRLSDAEAGHLEAFLRAEVKGKLDVKPKGNARVGATRFRLGLGPGDSGQHSALACANCHQVDDKSMVMALVSKALAFDQGCVSDNKAARRADVGLTPAQRNAVVAFLKTDLTSLQRETPAEFSLRQVKSLRCDSCHRRDGDITRWHAVLEDEGKVPENLPSLTWVGEKLQPDWTRKLFLGQSDHSARPWIKARMPAFASRADMLAVGLSHEHGFGVNDDPRPLHDAKLAAIGAKLIPQQGGFNCNNCHGIGKKPAIQPFEAPGINLVDAAVRLRYSYYQRWMLAPDRVDVSMRMPVFAPDGKTTQIRDVFDGDARRQYDALWHYIQTLPAKSK